MCGLGGWSWKNPPSRVSRKALGIALGTYNDERGGKGFGYFNIDRKRIQKGVETFTQFVAKEGSDFALAKQLFLHTRYPSTGATIPQNSHPFVCGPIVGAHNGIIRNHAELNKRYNRKFEVDSQHIFAHIAEGLEFKELEGYGTVEWYDQRDGKIRLLSFNNGDLEAFKIKNLGIVWSSSRTHLEKALEAAGLDEQLTCYFTKQKIVYVISDGELYEEAEVETSSYHSKVRWQDGYRGNSCSNTYSTSGGYYSSGKSSTPAITVGNNTNDYSIGGGNSTTDASKEDKKEQKPYGPPPGCEDTQKPPVENSSKEYLLLHETTTRKVQQNEQTAQELVESASRHEVTQEQRFGAEDPSGYYDDFANEIAWGDVFMFSYLWDGNGNKVETEYILAEWEYFKEQVGLEDKQSFEKELEQALSEMYIS